VTAVWCITLISRAGETGSVSFDGRSGQSLHVWWKKKKKLIFDVFDVNEYENPCLSTSFSVQHGNGEERNVRI
jgi:hypothetical protein